MTTAQGAAPRRRIGDVLVERQLITPDQLAQALRLRSVPGESRRLGQILLDEGMVSPWPLARALAESRGLPAEQLSARAPDPELARLVPREIAEKYLLVPIDRHDGALRIAVADPVDIVAVDDLRSRLPTQSIQIVVAPADQIRRRLDDVWGGTSETEVLERFVGEVAGQASQSTGQSQFTETEGGAIGIVKQIIDDALAQDASDIHIEPQHDQIMVRYRIDGMLRPALQLPGAGLASVSSRIKILAGMKIIERRVPQDGRIAHPFRGKTRQIRVSSLPSVHGETFVLRLLADSTELPEVARLGMPPDQAERFLSALHRSQGTILVTGPTGSGKTTTLYAGLRSAMSIDRSVLTLEDPVEIELAGITQVAVNEAVGMTFARGLRAAVRQDPDVILVGEVRDQETAELAMRAALTGHLVLTTLHTLNAPAAVLRMHDIGITPYVISSAVSLVIAQRLLRRICLQCREPTRIDSETLARLGLSEADALSFAVGVGCPDCNGTGYRGRVAAFEMLAMTPSVQRAVLDGLRGVAFERACEAAGWRPLLQAAINLARQRITSVTEIIRVALTVAEDVEPLPEGREHLDQAPDEDGAPPGEKADPTAPPIG